MQRLTAQLGQPVIQERDGRYFALKTAQDTCAFLDSDNLCSIHREQGERQKPRGCRQFPFRLVRTPDGIYVGASYFCPSIHANEGRPLAAHQAELLELAADLPQIRTVTVSPGVVLDWAHYRRLDDWLQQELEGELEPTLARALWALGQVVKTRQPARLTDFLAASFGALEPPHEPFVLVEENFSAALLARCEAPADQQDSFRAAWLSQKPVTFHRFNGWSGRRRDLKGPAIDPAYLRRYLQAVVFRKVLVTRRPLLQNLALLYLASDLFPVWARLASRVRGADRVEECDLYRAAAECENKVVTHPNDLDGLSETIAAGFLEQVDRL